MELFGYQKKFLRMIQESFKEQILEPLAKVLMVLATGLGKTIIAAFWAKEELKENPKQKILFLCHENNILDQAFDYFKIIVDGDTVMKKFYGQKDTKDFSADNAQIVFGSFQTFSRWRYGFDCGHFDILIVDESHHSQAETYKEVIEYFQVKKRFGMTATPDRMDMKDIRELFGTEIISCDLIEAILNGWLTPFEYHILNDYISNKKLREILEGVLKKKEKISVKQLNETIFIEKRDEEIVKEIAKYNDNFQKKTIIFCENIQHLQTFKESLPEGLEFHSLNRNNEENLQLFRDGKVKTILAVDKFNEGIDVPDVEVIVFLRGTDSSTIFFQQLGRGLRKLPWKEKVLVLDFVANIDRLLVISSLVERIRGSKGNDLAKRIFKISGNEFDYIFEDKKFEDVLDVIKCILAKTYISDIPRLAEEYSDKNELTANQVIAGTGKKLWWKCEICDHEWQARGQNRVRGKGCPACAGKASPPVKITLLTVRFDLANEFSFKNKVAASQIFYKTCKKFLWQCRVCGHEWKAAVYDRTKDKGTGCPACSNKVVTDKNNLAVTHPELVKEYHLTKNEKSANQVVAGTNKKLWWKCKICGHEWQATGASRINGNGCPACSGRVATDKNNMTITHPYLVAEYSKKNKLPPNEILASTSRKLWWECKICGYEWQARGDKRVRGSGCPNWKKHPKE